MALDAGHLQDALFRQVIAPLVLGGPMVPLNPIGPQRSSGFSAERPYADPDLASRVTMGRVRAARRLAPVDSFGPLTDAEWQLASVFNDVVQSTHPDYRNMFRKRGPQMILLILDDALDAIVQVANVGDALSRHTLFGRMFDLTRVDTKLTWWTGSATFLGTEVPNRLRLWPELRQVREERTPRRLMELAHAGKSQTPVVLFESVVAKFLSKSPLTDLATCDRPAPAFEWTPVNLGFIGTRNGRTLTLRALDRLRRGDVEDTLGRATRRLLDVRATTALSRVVDLLKERVLERAYAMLAIGRTPEGNALGDTSDRALALGLGAFAAVTELRETRASTDRDALLKILEPYTQSAAARDLSKQLAAG
jgi:hypothetical protein